MRTTIIAAVAAGACLLGCQSLAQAQDGLSYRPKMWTPVDADRDTAVRRRNCARTAHHAAARYAASRRSRIMQSAAVGAPE